MGSISPPAQLGRTTLGPNQISISRIINGLWQLAGGHDTHVDLPLAAEVMDDMISSGFDTFDMADHYGDAELVIGQHNQQLAPKTGRRTVAFSKWCPEENGDRSWENAQAAVEMALRRMGLERIELMQCMLCL